MEKVKRTERGWAGHFICSDRCLFRRNTLLEFGYMKIVVSTVGNYVYDCRLQEIGAGRCFETMVFHADKEDTKYFDADITKDVEVESSCIISEKGADDKANEMHELVVDEIMYKMRHGLIQDEK